MWCASAGVRPRSASSRTNPDSDGVPRASRRRARPPHRRGQQVAVQVSRVGVGDDDVRRQPLAVGQQHAPRPTALDEDLGDGGTGAQPGAALLGAREHRRSEPAQPAGDVPGAEGLLDVGHHGQRRRRAARVRPGVGRVAVEEHPQPRVAEVLLPQPAQRLPGRHGADVRRTPGKAQQVARAGQRRLEERLPRHLPDVAGPVEEALPVGAGPGAESLVERCPQPGRRGVGQVEPGHVVPTDGGEPVAGHRVDGHQVQRLLEGAAGRQEQVPVDVGEGQQRGPGVEREPVAAEGAQLAAPGLGLLADDHLVPERGEARGNREPGHAGTHHHDPRHGQTLRKVVRMPTARARSGEHEV